MPRTVVRPSPSLSARLKAESRLGPVVPFVPARARTWQAPHLATNVCLPATRLSPLWTTDWPQPAAASAATPVAATTPIRGTNLTFTRGNLHVLAAVRPARGARRPVPRRPPAGWPPRPPTRSAPAPWPPAPRASARADRPPRTATRPAGTRWPPPRRRPPDRTAAAPPRPGRRPPASARPRPARNGPPTRAERPPRPPRRRPCRRPPGTCWTRPAPGTPAAARPARRAPGA